MKETQPKMGTNKPKGISNKRQVRMGGVEYSNKHAGSHAKTEAQGVIIHGTHKACK